MPKLSFIDAKGANQEVELTASVYQAAADAQMTVPQYINSTYPTNAKKDGTAFEQFMANTGLFLRADARYGLRPPTMEQCVNGVAVMNAGVIVRDAQPASRILFPAVFLQAMEDKLAADTTGYVAMFEKLIAISDSINGARFEQPYLNYAGPEAARSQGISQLSLPSSMLSITTKDVARKIPTFSMGLEISQEALRATSLDLVSMALVRQAQVERAARVDGYIGTFLNGDADMGTTDLSGSTVTSDSLSPAVAAGALSHAAWVKWLRTNWRKRHIDWVMCDIATALKIENREGRPVITADDPNSPRINPTPQVANPQWQNVQIFLLEDGVVPADTVVGLDSRYAIRRVRNSQADYAAVEQFVLRKSEAMRFDFGEVAYRLFDDAWTVLQISP